MILKKSNHLIYKYMEFYVLTHLKIDGAFHFYQPKN